MRRYLVLAIIVLSAVMLAAACGKDQPAPTQVLEPPQDPRVDQLLMMLDDFGMRLERLEERFETLSRPAPTPMMMGTPTATPDHMMDEPTPPPPVTKEVPPTPTPTPEEANIQEIGIIENYAATRFFPQWMVVMKDVPVRMYMTRLHREHVNKFTISPFYDSSEVILPGEIGIIEFVPDQAGEFKIRNVGHNFEATLVVVETVEEANRLKLERGKQMFSIIHSVDEFRMFPDRLVLKEGIPARIHNISLIAEHQVSFKPFHTPEGFNVRPREINIVEFTPDQTGEFAIFHELHLFEGTLVVEE